MRFLIYGLVEYNLWILISLNLIPFFSFQFLICLHCILISISFSEANTKNLKICEVFDLWIGWVLFVIYYFSYSDSLFLIPSSDLCSLYSEFYIYFSGVNILDFWTGWVWFLNFFLLFGFPFSHSNFSFMFDVFWVLFNFSEANTENMKICEVFDFWIGLVWFLDSYFSYLWYHFLIPISDLCSFFYFRRHTI